MQYVNEFNENDRNILILYIKNCDKYVKEVNQIVDIVSKKVDYPNIHIFSEDLEERELLKNMDYYITERDHLTVRYTDFSYDLGINVLYGVAEKIFI